jgi:hypothetical protein
MVDADALRATVVRCVLLFVLLHVCLLALADDALNAYSKWAEVLTHAFAVPAMLRTTQMREQIVVATIVSVVYHCVRNFTDMDYDGIQRLDHAMSTALIATVFLKYFAHVTHVLGIIVLMAASAASFDFGNVLASAVTAAILVFIVAIPYVDKAVYHIVAVVVSCLSIGGVAPKVEDLEYTRQTRHRLLIAFSLQVLSVVFYYVGDNVERLFHWSHCLWHVFAYTCLYVLVDIISDKDAETTTSSAVAKEAPSRPSRKAFSSIGAPASNPRFNFRLF